MSQITWRTTGRFQPVCARSSASFSDGVRYPSVLRGGAQAQLTERRVAGRCRCHTPAHENKGAGGVVNGDEVRNIRFRKGSCYAASQVNDLLDRIAAELDAGRPVGWLITSATILG